MSAHHIEVTPDGTSCLHHLRQLRAVVQDLAYASAKRNSLGQLCFWQRHWRGKTLKCSLIPFALCDDGQRGQDSSRQTEIACRYRFVDGRLVQLGHPQIIGYRLPMQAEKQFFLRVIA